MTALLAVSIVPWNLTVLVGFVFLVAAGVVWYALRTKGNVRAMFSHGKTVLELEAKEPQSRRK